ncbi:hypothetical protein TNCV_4988331 [Trichonephila clavipes]|nr:hypothetical protein TNCV_4988331 [Trichonephila clavipes]
MTPGPAFIRKHNRSPLRPPMSSGLTLLASQMAMVSKGVFVEPLELEGVFVELLELEGFFEKPLELEDVFVELLELEGVFVKPLERERSFVELLVRESSSVEPYFTHTLRRTYFKIIFKVGQYVIGTLYKGD